MAKMLLKITVALTKYARKYISFYHQTLQLGPNDAPRNWLQSVMQKIPLLIF
jgi:hypothetical protein